MKASNRILAMVLLILPGFQSAISVASDVAPAPSTAEWKTLSDAFLAAGEDRCDEVMTVIPVAVDRDSFSGFPVFVRRKSLEHLLECLQKTDNYAAIESRLQMLADLGGPNAPAILRELIWSSTSSKKPIVAVDAVKSLAEYGRNELRRYKTRKFSRLHKLLRTDEKNSDLRYEFLQVLYENDFTSGYPFFPADELMLDYAVMSIDRGNTQDIGKIVLSFTVPSVILRVRIDKRFDAIRQDGVLEDFLDLENAADRNIARLEGLIERWPNYAYGYVLYTQALLGSWRFKDALDAIEPIALKIREPDANEMFTDVKNSMNRVLESYAIALAAERYPEQSDDMFREAVDVPEIGSANVTQRLHMAGALVSNGRFDKAMELLEELRKSDTNSLGKMWVNSYVACANVMREDRRDYSPNMAYLIAHERDNPTALILALLCTDDPATAAQHLIRRLQNLDQRMLALLYLQYRKWDMDRKTHEHVTMAGLSPGHIIAHRIDQLRERRDLLEAIERVGRLEEVPLHSSVWLRY